MSEHALETACDSDPFSRGAAFPSLTANLSCQSGLGWSEAVHVGSGFGQNLIRETTGGVTGDYLYGPGIDEPLAMVKNGQVSYFNVDGLGSVVATNDPAGSVTHSVVFDAWGNTRAETGTRTHPFTYTGREVGEAGLLFYRARYYQPSIGRFTQMDPLGERTGMERYGYGLANPVINVDSFGLFAIKPSCNKAPWGPNLTAGVTDLCGKRLAPGSPCSNMLRNVSQAMFGSPDKIPDCMNKQCGGTLPINCDPECGPCASSTALGGIVVGPGNGGCPIDAPNPRNNFQGPIGVGETIFHETLHFCAFGSEPSQPGVTASWFRLLEGKCYGWRDPNAPLTGAPR